MKKKLLILMMTLALATVCFLTGCGGDSKTTSKSDDEVYTITCAHLCTEDDSMHVGALHFKETIEKASDGRIAVDIYPNKQMATSDPEMIEMCRNGSIQMCITTNYNSCGLNENLKSPYIFDYPYLFESSEELYAVADSEIGQKVNDDIAELSNGVITFGGYTPSWYQIILAKDKVEKMADFKGLKIRSPNSTLNVAYLTKFGINPTVVNYGEVYSAMQQGTVDGAYVAANLMCSEKYYEICDYVAEINTCPHYLLPYYNKEFVESLPEDLQKIFNECAEEYVQWIRDYCTGVAEESMETLAKNCEVVKFSDSAMEEMREAGRSTWKETADVCGGMDLINEVQAFLEDYRKNK
ncbi:TRAP transporter substrate-binding protein [Anaerovorax odorimutans]|uniref:TRAP transporter substrate-binding protein n=1 Tax=Anaerovorax odorimutans TaxID=109327 RepID=A0ABT1RNS1_9FIRM|nr:TRAP transporter substrate-binding protein [Anaerovorax odorimutans]MCQ4636818.1 TRAP transporter substrate-binding protein [Anaerovorax odorimutans]